MKVKRQDLKKIILLLEELYNKNKDEIIDILSAFSKTDIEDQFVLPERWFINRTNSSEEMDIIYNYMHSGLVSNGEHWKHIYCNDYYLHSDGVGHSNKYDNFTLITFKQFKKYIVDAKLKIE